jgi:acetolactate synthase-1/2/3 large subunit
MAEALNDADLVFLVESVGPWHPPSALPAAGTRVAVLGEDPLHARVPFWGFRADIIVAGDAEASLAMLAEQVRQVVAPGSRAATIEKWRARNDERRAANRKAARAAGARPTIETSWVAHELDAVLPSGAAVINETITHRLDIARILDRMTPGGYFEASYGGLGMGIGMALGVKAAHPNRTVVNLIGDGAFHYNPVVGSFGAAQEHGLPILVVLFDNAGYRSQKGDVINEYPDGWAVKTNRFAGTSITPRPDYALLARAYGGYGETVSAPEEVRAALKRGLDAVAKGQLALIVMQLDPVNPQDLA